MVRMPALLTKISIVPRASVALATAARSSLAEALSAFSDSALPPADSTSRTSWRALSSEVEYVKATDAPSAASRRTMPAPMPLEPPVTRATLPLNDLVCIATIHILQFHSCTFWMTLSRIRIQPGGINCKGMFNTRSRSSGELLMDLLPRDGRSSVDLIFPVCLLRRVEMNLHVLKRKARIELVVNESQNLNDVFWSFVL